MPDLPQLPITLGVFPVLIGPLQTLLALLPAILIGVGSMLMAVFKPGGFSKLVRFCWRQKLFLAAMIGIVVAWRSGIPAGYLQAPRTPAGLHAASATASDWNSARGGLQRLGRGPGQVDAGAPGVNWSYHRDKTILSSPAVSGDQVIFSTATDIGPFTPEGRGAIVCVDAHSGQEIWRYAPENYRATFSSPVIAGNSVICGEGLHQVEDARVTCLDLRSGQRRWEFRTKSHVEATAAIADGRVFIGAGSDGFYCLALDSGDQTQPKVLWRLEGKEFPDCESSPIVHAGVVYFGLGEEGSAVCAVQADTGRLLWKLTTPYPVFAPPSIADGKLYIATGNGNFVQSAADLLAMKLQIMRDEGATEAQLSEAAERLKAVGEVWCIDLATRAVDWKVSTADAILGAVICGDDAIYFGSRDGHVYRVSKTGSLLNKHDLREPIISSPSLGWKHIYCTTASGRLFCLEAASLKPAWDCGLGTGETFSSSPILAHGHLYVGTAKLGLQCIGRPGDPPLSIWTRGDLGGNVDDVPIPDEPEVLWMYPANDDPEFSVTAPLMPLDGALYVAGRRHGRAEFVKLNTDSTTDAGRTVWSRTFPGVIEAAPVGCGEGLCVVERAANGSSATIHCLSSHNGEDHWIHPITGLSPLTSPSRDAARRAGITIDSSHVIFWTGRSELGCLELKSGSLLWDQQSANVVRTVPGETGIGIPVIAGDLLLAITEPENSSSASATLRAFDLLSGILLWQAPIHGEALGSPIIVDDVHVLAPQSKQLTAYSLVDGSVVDAAGPTVSALKVDDSGRPVTSPIHLKGRVYSVTDRGGVLCQGAGTP